MADLGCSPNAAIAFDYLTGKGLSDFQAAAVIGNLQWESGLNPRLEAMDINGLPGRGIAMWQPPRWQNLLTFAAGRDPRSLDVQLDFLWSELPSAGLTPLLASTQLEDAVTIFQDRFEKPRAAYAHTDKRIELARAALYACPPIKPPPNPPRRVGIVAAAAGVVALVAATSYGVYKALGAREPERPEPRPRPVPAFPPPRFRPTPTRPPWSP